MKTLSQYITESFDEHYALLEKKIYHTPEFLKKKAKMDAERDRREKAEELERERQRKKGKKSDEDEPETDDEKSKDEPEFNEPEDKKDEPEVKKPESKDDEDDYAEHKQDNDPKFYDSKKKDASLNSILSKGYDDISFDDEELTLKATPKDIRSYQDSYRTTNEKLKKRYDKEDDEIKYQRRVAKDALAHKREIEDAQNKKRNDARIAYKKENLSAEEFAEWSQSNKKLLKNNGIKLNNARQAEDESIQTENVEYDDKVSKKRESHDKSLEAKFLKGLKNTQQKVQDTAKDFISGLWSGDHASSSY